MDTKWNSTGPDEGLEQLVAGEVREALKGVEDAPGVAKVRVSGKTCGAEMCQQQLYCAHVKV